MTSDSQSPREHQSNETPSADELEEPSTEKDPGAEPKAAQPADPEPSHEAVGIGVIGGPLVDPEPDADPDPAAAAESDQSDD
jgi:hypothetical protein